MCPARIEVVTRALTITRSPVGRVLGCRVCQTRTIAVTADYDEFLIIAKEFFADHRSCADGVPQPRRATG
jgi:hypothetical protein